MTEKRTYQGRESDLARWKESHKHMRRCGMCSNGGNYACKVLDTCKATAWHSLEEGNSGEFQRYTRIGDGGRVFVPYNHSHRCLCTVSGGEIMEKQLRFEIEGGEEINA